MNSWFTADCHFGHKNIIKYCNRPFVDVEDMNKTIIHNWNMRVHKNDTVFHIGDFCFRNTKGGKDGEGLLVPASEYEKQLNGKIIFIRGNHDNNNSCKTPIYRMTIHFGGHYIGLIHNPDNVINDSEFYLVGHVHNHWLCKRQKTGEGIRGEIDCINVGMDVWDFKPVSINEIMGRYKKWLKKGEEK